MDRVTELAVLLTDALKRGDLATAGKLQAEQRKIIERDYADRVPVTADPLPFLQFRPLCPDAITRASTP